MCFVEEIWNLVEWNIFIKLNKYGELEIQYFIGQIERSHSSAIDMAQSKIPQILMGGGAALAAITGYN